jgi:hypothetical protein
MSQKQEQISLKWSQVHIQISNQSPGYQLGRHDFDNKFHTQGFSSGHLNLDPMTHYEKIAQHQKNIPAGKEAQVSTTLKVPGLRLGDKTKSAEVPAF